MRIYVWCVYMHVCVWCVLCVVYMCLYVGEECVSEDYAVVK